MKVQTPDLRFFLESITMSNEHPVFIGTVLEQAQVPAP
jgi:hypothetical protein